VTNSDRTDAARTIDLLHVVGDGQPGGGTTVVLTLCREFAQLGYRVGIASQLGSYILDEAAAAGLTTIDLPFERRTSTPRLAHALRELVRHRKVGLLHAHGARAGLPAALARGYGTPLAYTVHGFHFPRKSAPGKLLGKAAERFCIARSDCAIFVGEGDLEIARAHRLLGNARHVVIRNGVRMPDVAAVPDSDKSFDVAFLARLHHQKNPLILPEIAAACRSSMRMVVVGGGDLEVALQKKVQSMGLSDRMSLVGMQDREAGLSFLARSRMMILPSLWEGLPIAPIEAMYLGLPVIASDVAGNREAVVHSETGFLVPAEEPEGYARRIDALLESEPLRTAMGQAGAQRANSQFHIDRQVAEHLRVYAQLGLAAPPSRL
jgi:glycosyltransferase involved in cell wall biosynthesis